MRGEDFLSSSSILMPHVTIIVLQHHAKQAITTLGQEISKNHVGLGHFTPPKEALQSP